jgi:monoamine oxidase
MDLRNNPYRHKLRPVFEQLSDAGIPVEQIDVPNLFEFSSTDDPVSLIAQANTVSQIPDSVAVIGAGIAGLTAAHEFLRIADRFGRPKRIRVFERTPRIGGRVLTHQFADGAYAELGPMRLPAYHKIALHYVADLGLALQTFPTSNATFHFSRVAQTSSRVDGKAAGLALAKSYDDFRPADAPRLDYFFPPDQGVAPSLGTVEECFLNTFEDAFRPQSPFGREVPRAHMDMLDLYSNRPLSEWGRNVEGMTVRQAFLQFVAHCSKKIPDDQRNRIDECAEFMWETYGRAFGWVWLEHISMAHFLRETKGFSGGGAKYAIKGGFGRLVDAFIRRLKADARVSIGVREPVFRVKISRGSGTEVHFRTPFGSDMDNFDKVICAAPASAVTRIQFDPPLNAQTYNALSSISYLGASKSAALFRERFWERDASVPQLGGVTYTDLENQRIWYPHDNIVYDDEQGPLVPRVGEPPVLKQELRSPFSLQNEDVSRGPGAVLAAYMWGENSRRFASCTSGERDDIIVRCLETVHPGCRKHLIDLVHWSWDAQSNPGGGAFAWYQPGQQSRYQQVATRPHPGEAVPEAKVFFAGEHLGLIQGWVQSAMATALDAVIRACGCRAD